MLLSVVVLGACRTARLLGEDLASDADLSAVHTINPDVLQKLTAFPSCIASCAFGVSPRFFFWLFMLCTLVVQGK